MRDDLPRMVWVGTVEEADGIESAVVVVEVEVKVGGVGRAIASKVIEEQTFVLVLPRDKSGDLPVSVGQADDAF